MAVLYAIYRGDEFIDVGTVKELAKRLNVKENTIWHMATPTHFKRTNYNDAMRAYKLESDGEANK